MSHIVVDPENLVAQIYAPPQGSPTWSFSKFIKRDVYYFSYARQALYAGLLSVGIGPGDRVLVPGLICADLIPAITALGAMPDYYDVGIDLTPAEDLNKFQRAKAVLAVNYFGFSQPLTVFQNYCSENNSVLIEDNAHGLFSRDKQGRVLGSRGNLGLFSLRKTLPLFNGAALVINRPELLRVTPSRPEQGKDRLPLSWYGKKVARKLVPLVGVKCLRAIIASGRFVRDHISRNKDLQPLYGENLSAFEATGPYGDFMKDVAMTDATQEIERRRNLYLWLDEYLRGSNCEPVFDRLGDEVVPYGYPFFADKKDIPDIRRNLAKAGLDCFNWPELPDEVLPTAPDWYHKIWSVQFLW